MDEQIRRSNKFLSGIHMGNHIFKEYYNIAHDDELKDTLLEIIDLFLEHKEKMQKAISDLGGDPTDKLTFLEQIGSFIEKIKIMNVDDDFTICKYAIEAITMGIVGANEVIHQNRDLCDSIKNVIYDIEKDYDNILTKIKVLMKKY